LCASACECLLRSLLLSMPISLLCVLSVHDQCCPSRASLGEQNLNVLGCTHKNIVSVFTDWVMRTLGHFALACLSSCGIVRCTAPCFFFCVTWFKFVWSVLGSLPFGTQVALLVFVHAAAMCVHACPSYSVCCVYMLHACLSCVPSFFLVLSCSCRAHFISLDLASDASDFYM